MEIRQLNYFQEIAKHKSMTKAADSLHISQPALSKMMKSLEDEIGLPLLNRTNKICELTDSGIIVLEYTKKIQSLFHEMSDTLNDMTNLQRGNIHIGLPPFAGSLFFPKVIAKFHEQYSNIQINITENGAARIVKSVEDGELDLGVAVLPIEERNLNVYPIVEDEMKLLVPTSHPYANRNCVSLHDLKDEKFIFYNEDFGLYHLIKKEFLKQGIELKILFKSSQWDFMVEMVAAKLGVAVLPEPFCRLILHKEIRMIDIEPVILRKLAVITKKDRYISYAARKFIDFILNEKQFCSNYNF